MKRAPHFVTRTLVSSLVAVGLFGCGAMEVKQDVVQTAQAVRKGPEYPPERSITNFSAGLRCMDNLMIDYGVKDVTVMVEDIVDQTKKVNAGTKDMLISAVSDMTKRSHAVRLVAYGTDSGNAIGFMQQAGNKGMFAAIPELDIKGSISQFDESIARKQIDGGISVAPFVNIGAAKNASANVIGLDLTMLTTNDLSVVPGVTSRNSVVVYRDGKAVDTEATIKKFGINFSMSLNKAEGQAQALRTLVELASIELFGKLTKTPYWTCVGADPNDEVVKQEISDWFYSMSSEPEQLLGWWQVQMRRRGLYNGQIDGVPTQEFKDAIANYRTVLGMSKEPKIGLEFFSAYLHANHAELAPRVAQFKPAVAKTAAAPAAAPAAAAAAPAKTAVSAPAPRLEVAMASSNNAAKFKKGEAIKLVVKTNRDANVYCFWKDETGSIQRFYPNRFAKDSRVKGASPLEIPGSMRFELVANSKGINEAATCIATDRDVMFDLPSTVAGNDFEPLPVKSFDQVRDAFAKVAGPGMGHTEFPIELR